MEQRYLETIEEMRAEFRKGVRLEHLIAMRKMLVRKIKCGNSEAAKLFPKLDQIIQRFPKVRKHDSRGWNPGLFNSID